MFERLTLTSTISTKEIRHLYWLLSQYVNVKKNCANQPRSPLRMSQCMGGPVCQLMTEILHTISVLNTWISSHEWFSSQLRTMWKISCRGKTRNFMGFHSGMCPLRALGDMQRQHILAWFHSVLWYRAAVDLRFIPVMGRIPWSCGAVILLAIISSCRAVTLESIHWSSSNAK